MSARLAFSPVVRRVSRWTVRRLQTTTDTSARTVASCASETAVALTSGCDFQAIFREAAIGMHVTDLRRRLVESNAAFQHLTGYQAEELGGMPLVRLMHPDDCMRDAELHRELLTGTCDNYQTELRYRSRTGQTMWVRMFVSLVHDVAGEPQYILGVVEPIAARKRREEQLTHHAYFDVLTDLPNRLLFYDRLGQTLRAAQRTRTGFAVLLLDLDRFKAVNDALGHRAGDVVLRQVADRLQGSVRGADTVARFGGDEFVALLPNADMRAAIVGAGRLLHTLKDPFVVEGQRRQIGASIGVSLYPEHGDDVGTLLHRADQAMYAAKRSHGGYVLYEAIAPAATRTHALS